MPSTVKNRRFHTGTPRHVHARVTKEDARDTLRFARSMIRDLIHGFQAKDLVVDPRALCVDLTELIGDKFDFESGEES